MFNLTLVTPEKRVVLNQDVVFVSVPGFGGEIDLLPGHSPLITTLETGPLTYKLKGSDVVNKFIISWGYCQVSPEGVNILADFLQSQEEINVDQANTAIDVNSKRLLTESLNDNEYKEVQGLVARAQAALSLIKKH